MNLHDKIAKVAYVLYEKNGKIEGKDIDYWLEAEILVKDALNQESPESTKEKGGRRRVQQRKI